MLKNFIGIMIVCLAISACSKQEASQKATDAKEAKNANQAASAVKDEKPVLPPESYKGITPDEIGFELMDMESFGEIKLNMSDTDVIKKLGEPESKSKAELMGADDLYHQSWEYKKEGISLDMSGKNKTKLSVCTISINTPCKLKTKRNIGVGSSLEDALAAYKKAIPEPNADPNRVVAGTDFGGLIFDIQNKKVNGMFLGAAAE